MAIRDKLKENAARLLQPGEQIQAVIPAQTTSAYFALISYWIIILRNSFRVIVVTDRRILVCRSGRFRQSAVSEVEREISRHTVIGPAEGGLWYRTDALGETLHISRRYFKDIEAADRAMGQAPA